MRKQQLDPEQPPMDPEEFERERRERREEKKRKAEAARGLARARSMDREDEKEERKRAKLTSEGGWYETSNNAEPGMSATDSHEEEPPRASSTGRSRWTDWSRESGPGTLGNQIPSMRHDKMEQHSRPPTKQADNQEETAKTSGSALDMEAPPESTHEEASHPAQSSTNPSPTHDVSDNHGAPGTNSPLDISQEDNDDELNGGTSNKESPDGSQVEESIEQLENELDEMEKMLEEFQ